MAFLRRGKFNQKLKMGIVAKEQRGKGTKNTEYKSISHKLKGKRENGFSLTDLLATKRHKRHEKAATVHKDSIGEDSESFCQPGTSLRKSLLEASFSKSFSNPSGHLSMAYINYVG